jgi:hypothetical protein
MVNDKPQLFNISPKYKLASTIYASTDVNKHSILYFHSLVGSRPEAHPWHSTAVNPGIQLSAVDRPSLGQSSLQPGHTMLDRPHDIKELAAHLRLEESSVLDVSDGGPYALGCTKALPSSQLRSVESQHLGSWPVKGSVAMTDLAHLLLHGFHGW